MGSIPPIFETGPRQYLRTIARFRAALDVETIIPGHGAPADGAILGRYLAYLGQLIDTVAAAKRAGQSFDETLAAFPLPTAYRPAAESPWRAFLDGLHALNVQRAYLEREIGGSS